MCQLKKKEKIYKKPERERERSKSWVWMSASLPFPSCCCCIYIYKLVIHCEIVRMWMCNDRKKNFAAWLNILVTGTHTPLFMYWNRRHPNSQMSSHCFHLVRTFEGKIYIKNVLSISAITPHTTPTQMVNKFLLSSFDD